MKLLVLLMIFSASAFAEEIKVISGGAARGAVEPLAAIGCDLAQGFHYSPPVPGDRIPGLVRAAAALHVGVADVTAG